MLVFSVIAALLYAPSVVETVTYRVDPAESRVVIEVGSAGFLRFFGHDHRIEASGLSGEASFDVEAPETSRFVLEIDASSLSVADPELSDEDRAQIQSDMESKALALPEHPAIRFESESVRVRERGEGTFELDIDGTLSLRGVDKALRVPVTVKIEEGRLSAKGELELGSDAWGVPQIAVAGGTVKTKKELGITFDIVARR